MPARKGIDLLPNPNHVARFAIFFLGRNFQRARKRHCQQVFAPSKKTPPIRPCVPCSSTPPPVRPHLATPPPVRSLLIHPATCAFPSRPHPAVCVPRRSPNPPVRSLLIRPATRACPSRPHPAVCVPRRSTHPPVRSHPLPSPLLRLPFCAFELAVAMYPFCAFCAFCG